MGGALAMHPGGTERAVDTSTPGPAPAPAPARDPAGSAVADHDVAGVRPTRAGAPAGPGVRELSSGRSVREIGIVSSSGGVRLREQPSTSADVLGHLPLNTHLFVDSERRGWFFVGLNDGRIGYCAAEYIKTDLPEPNANLYQVRSGDTALGISLRHYPGAAVWGSDHRFFINALVHVNAGPGLRGIDKPRADASWAETQVRAGYWIWIPSLPFLRSLRDRVSSGSISYEAWDAVKTAAAAVADFVIGTGAFIVGLLHGALESLWDVLAGVVGLVTMVWDVLRSVLTGSLLSDARGLWNDIKNLDWGELVEGWIDQFDRRWNASSVASRWHFRGWVTGYAVMEVLMLVLSGGIISGIKWVGKAAKLAGVLAAIPRVARAAAALRRSRRAAQLARRLRRSDGTPGGTGGGAPRRSRGHTAEGVGDDFTHGPLPEVADDIPVQTRRGPSRSEAETLEDYADAMRPTGPGSRRSPASSAARESGTGGAHIRENLYTGTTQTRVTRNLVRHGVLEVTEDTLRVLDPDRYLRWLRRAYRRHGGAHLDPRVEAAVRRYVQSDDRLPTVGVNPAARGSSRAGSLPGTHAEVLAVNDVLASGGSARVVVATVRRTGGHFAACLHCGGILRELRRSIPELRIATGSAR
ncbi:SH3 domain-containing protein [Isoptericola sp. G70]|uniref:SH3 domain-containing protein n=1 Tax=Isoptericola sp. G70 TaxID=3376633 RepID=UPI003A800F98